MATEHTSHFEEQANFVRFREVTKTRSRRLVAFTGAGASLEAGLPTWGGFIEGLAAHARQSTETQIGTGILDAELEKLPALDTDWDRVEFLYTTLRLQFENAVRDTLTPKNSLLPTFYRRVWDLNPNALLTVNLDNFALESHAKLLSGVPARYYTGVQVSQSRDIFSDNRPLIVNLHGSIDTPSSWVLTKTHRDTLLSNSAYLEFLKSIFNYNVVLFYGVGIYEGSISNQIMYLNSLGFVTGEYFVLRKRPTKPEHGASPLDTPIRTIWLPDALSWEEGFSAFVDAAIPAVAEPVPAPVIPVASAASSGTLPTVAMLMTMPPDEVRKLLATQTSRYFHDGNFDYAQYSDFCREYDLAINHASRVRIDTNNDVWLGYHLTDSLGAGNFGRVFRAERDAEEFALKIAHDSVRDSETMLDSFRRGVASMRILTSSGISGVVGLKDAAELPPSIVMEYVPGLDLQKFIETRAYRQDVDLVLRIILRVCEILFACHSHEKVILHRDLRPSNIMLRGFTSSDITEESVTILDFDLSWYKGATGSEYLMSPLASLGYLAPEQIDPAAKFSPRSALVDVYGAAMLLYFSLSGDHPPANASTKYDWDHKVEHATQITHTQRWRTLKSIVKRAIVSCTGEQQDSRWDLQRLMDVLREIITIRKDGFTTNPLFLLEEIAVRSMGNIALEVGYDNIRAVTSSGISVMATVDDVSGRYGIDVSMMDDGSINRANRAKFFDRSLARAVDAAEKIGVVDRRRSGVHRGGSKLHFGVYIPRNIAELTKLASGLEQIISSFRMAD